MDAGYENYIEVVLNADKFGVPQRRNRFFILASRDPNLKLSAPIPQNLPAPTVNEAFAGLPNVIPNSGEEKFEYTGDESEYSMLLKDNSFWKLQSTSTKLSYQMPMKHRLCTLKRFSLLKPGESLKDLFDRYVGEERAILQEAMSGIQEANGRIYRVDDSLGLFVEHAIAAARQFISDRRRLNNAWIAQA